MDDILSEITKPFFSPSNLAMNLWPDGHDKWIPAKHLLYASAQIQSAIAKGNGRIMISMHPRAGKSRLVGETVIPWYMEKYPGRDVMLASYNDELAEGFGRAARDIIVSRPKLFKTRIRKDVKRVDLFQTTAGGKAQFFGLLSGATGKGADLLIIDDYIKGIDDALSPTFLEKLWLRFLANMDSRLAPGATIIIVATRWVSDDLIGRILKSPLKDDWTYIEFPAIAEENDILGRKVGEALFPERYPIERLEKIKVMRAGTFLWESLYQQRPIDDFNSLTNVAWIQYSEELGGNHLSSLNKVRAWDFASTEGGGDPTTGTLMGKELDRSQAYILDIKQVQKSPAGVEDEIRRNAEIDGRNVTIVLEQEPGSQGAHLIEHYKINVLPEFNVIGVPVGNKSKIVRAQPLIAAIEYGRVKLERGDWNGHFVTEFGTFPKEGSGFHDDQIDTAALCYNQLFGDDTKSPVWWGGDGDSGFFESGNIISGGKKKIIVPKTNEIITGGVW